MRRCAAPLLVIALLVAGCGGPSPREAPAALPAKGVAIAEADAVASAAPRRVVRTATVTLVTDDLDTLEDRLGELLSQFKGFVGDASVTGARGSLRTASWTVRVPATALDPFLRAAGDLGEVQSSARTGNDVTAEFVDSEARLRNKRLEEARLLALLTRGGTNLDAVLRVERELSRVRGEIESLQGALRLMRSQTDLATVTIEAREAKAFRPEGPPTLGVRVARVWSDSLAALRDFAVGLLVLVVALIPWLALLAIVAAPLLALRRRRRRPPGPG